MNSDGMVVGDAEFGEDGFDFAPLELERGRELRECPSASGASSTVKPGGSVAISKRTPPGSRK